MLKRRTRVYWLAALVLILVSKPLAAQDLEPRRWTHLPTGTNTFALGYAGRNLDIHNNPMPGISDGSADTNAWLARYSFSFNWSYELAGSVYIFGDNKNFVDSVELSQDPICALQGHVTRNFKRNFWLGAGMAYAYGGDGRVDGTRTTYTVDNVLWNLVGS